MWRWTCRLRTRIWGWVWVDISLGESATLHDIIQSDGRFASLHSMVDSSAKGRNLEAHLRRIHINKRHTPNNSAAVPYQTH